MKIEIKEISFDEVVMFISDVITVSEFLNVDAVKTKYSEYTTGPKYLGTEEVCYEDVLASVLMDNQPLYIYDEDGEYVLTLDKMKTGLSLLFDNKLESFISIIEETYDYEDLYYWLQYSLFGEIVWG